MINLWLGVVVAQSSPLSSHEAGSSACLPPEDERPKSRNYGRAQFLCRRRGHQIGRANQVAAGERKRWKPKRKMKTLNRPSRFAADASQTNAPHKLKWIREQARRPANSGLARWPANSRVRSRPPSFIIMIILSLHFRLGFDNDNNNNTYSVIIEME